MNLGGIKLDWRILWRAFLEALWGITSRFFADVAEETYNLVAEAAAQDGTSEEKREWFEKAWKQYVSSLDDASDDLLSWSSVLNLFRELAYNLYKTRNKGADL